MSSFKPLEWKTEYSVIASRINKLNPEEMKMQQKTAQTIDRLTKHPGSYPRLTYDELELYLKVWHGDKLKAQHDQNEYVYHHLNQINSGIDSIQLELEIENSVTFTSN